MVRIAIIGAAGRMGRRLVSLIGEDPELTLAAALEHDACELLGQDAGVVADGKEQGVIITTDLAAADVQDCNQSATCHF